MASDIAVPQLGESISEATLDDVLGRIEHAHARLNRLPGKAGAVIRVRDNPDLNQLIGCTLVTTDGTTLLGADDKAGVAVIMETAARLQEQPEVKHGAIRICFTCDEEIGHGVDHVDLGELGATACYTLDGHGADEIRPQVLPPGRTTPDSKKMAPPTQK